MDMDLSIIFFALLIIVAFVVAFKMFAIVKIVTYIILAFVIIAIFFKFFVKKYDEYERAIIFRMGKFNRVAGPGWSIVIPFFEKEFSKVDVRTKMINLSVPSAFTSDDLRLQIDGMIYYKIMDPNKALLNIDNYMNGLTTLLVSETRNLIASFTMRDLFGKLSKLNELLTEAIRHNVWKWGIDVPMIQIKSIMPPEEISVAMQQKEIEAQMMQATRFKAEAQKVVIEALGEAAKKLDDRAIVYLYIKALEEMSKGSATKIILPMGVKNIADSLGEGLGLGTGLGAGLDVNAAIKAIQSKLSA